MKPFWVRLEVWHRVDAESEDDAKWVALNDLAFGRVSTLDAMVTEVTDAAR